jgi:PDDEXK-like uncharacterized protein DUF3799
MKITADDDIDALLGDTFAKVGDSPKVAAAAAKLEVHIAASRPLPRDLVDPRSLPVRFTRLKAFALSPAHYLLACQGDAKETLALRIGAGFHAELFRNRPVRCWHDRRSGKAWERFEQRCLEEGAVVLNENEYRTQLGMLASVKRHRRAMELLFDGTRNEQQIDWTHGDRSCRSTPDAFHAAGLHQAELKSTRCAEPRWLAREALRRFYHAQMTFYDGPIERVTGRVPGEDRIVAVENVPPFNVTVLRLTDEVRELGTKLCHAWWERLHAAETLNLYGGYVEADVDLELPDYQNHEPATVEIDGQLVTID